jgi:hypothetical protein
MFRRDSADARMSSDRMKRVEGPAATGVSVAVTVRSFATEVEGERAIPRFAVNVDIGRRKAYGFDWSRPSPAAPAPRHHDARFSQ